MALNKEPLYLDGKARYGAGKERRTALIGLILAIAIDLTPLAYAQNPGHPEEAGIVPAVRIWQKNLDELEKRLMVSDLDEFRLTELQKSLDRLRLNIRIASDDAQPEIKIIQDDLQALGKPPAAEQPPESTSVAARRQLLNRQLALAEGSIKEAELLINRADRLANDISDLRRSRFTARLLTQGPSPLSLGIWKAASNQWGTVRFALYERARQLSGREGFQAAWHRLLWIFLFTLGCGMFLQSILSRQRFSLPRDENTPHLNRYLDLIQRQSIHAFWLPVTVIGLIGAPSLDSFWQEPLVELLQQAGCVLLGSLAIVTAMNGAEPRSRTRSLLLAGLAMCLGMDWMTSNLLNMVEEAGELLLLERFAFTWVIPAFLMGLIRYSGGSDTPVFRLRGLDWMLGFTLLSIPLASLLGYVALARLLAVQWLLTGGLFWVTRELLSLNPEVVGLIFSADSGSGIRLRQILGLSEDSAELLQFWAHELARLMIFITAGLGFLMLWGAGGSDLATWLYKAFFGFRIGNLSFSLANLLWATLSLIGLLAGTRLLQRMLDTRIFPKTRWDNGIRHSLRSALGYLGFTIAVISAMTSLGVDLSNLAIIAGALSVGIGFGMQNIVNNFISGLILLVERPIKVGDWVVVGEHQGYVKKISVRATEITTFDRASVFIPNSSLISGNVMNRTHADKVGRILLPLGIPYGVDAKRLRSLLLEIAESHPEVRRNPAPFVVLKGFGETALNFELFAFVNDVDNVLSVTSDLCLEIDALLRSEGIEMAGSPREMRLVMDSGQASMLFGTQLANRSEA